MNSVPDGLAPTVAMLGKDSGYLFLRGGVRSGKSWSTMLRLGEGCRERADKVSFEASRRQRAILCAHTQLILTSITRFLTRLGWSGVWKLDLPDIANQSKVGPLWSTKTQRYATTHVLNKIVNNFIGQISSHRRPSKQAMAQPRRIAHVKLIIYQRGAIYIL